MTQQTNPLHLENTVLHLGRRDLSIQNCFRTYRDMKLDPIIGGSLSFVKAIISKTPYQVKAARGSTAAQKKLVKAINDSLSNTPYGRKRLMDGVLSMLDYGASMFEIVAQKDSSQQWVFKNLSPVHLSTVNRFTFDGGELLKVELNPATNDGLVVQVGNPINLDGKKVLMFRLESDQDFPLGKSLLYGCYTAWKTKSILNEYTTIGAAKNLSTVVQVKLPMEYINSYYNEPTSDQALYTTELLASVENLHAGKSCYAVIPSDLSDGGQSLFEISTIGGGNSNTTFDAEVSIERYNREMLFNLQTSVLSLGSNSQGSFSLAENSTNLLGLFIQNVFSVIQSDFEKAIKLLWEMNGADMAKLPTLEFDDIDERDLKVFAEAWTKLVGAGAVTVDEESEAQIRKDFGMPEKPANTPAAAVPVQEVPEQPAQEKEGE